MQLTSIPTMVVSSVSFALSFPQAILRPTFDINKAIETRSSHLNLIRMGKTRARPAIQRFLLQIDRRDRRAIQGGRTILSLQIS